MSERIRGDLSTLGDAYHQLFQGQETEMAEAAAYHFAECLETFRLFVKPPK